MIMLCDFEKANASLKDVQTSLALLGEQIGVSIHIQHEDIFNAMHKI